MSPLINLAFVALHVGLGYLAYTRNDSFGIGLNTAFGITQLTLAVSKLL